MIRGIFVGVIFALVVAHPILAAEKTLSPQEQQQLEAATQAQRKEEDLRRELAVAEFTQKMNAANYPALFEQAANEFNVPADVLKGVAFAETRWEHLTWPPGETASPETGMPRPFGIMSLWDNKYFGHSLLEAANLIGRDPEELKQDPLQNMRGGAALLRKLYDQTPRADGSSQAEIESWRYAIRAYSGIPEPDLNARHALDVYTFMNQGYHQFGIEWNARPVDLEPMRQETRQIVAEEQKKREMLMAANPNSRDQAGQASNNAAPAALGKLKTEVSNTTGPKAQPTPAAPEAPASPAMRRSWWPILAVIAILAALFAFFENRTKKPPSNKSK
jgi:hypothetical protein